MQRLRPSTIVFGALLLFSGLSACRKDPQVPLPDVGPTPYVLPLPPWALADTNHHLNLPYDNPLTVEGIALGRKLFYEKALSNDLSMSCATCHQQEHAFSDPRQFSLGTNGVAGRRNAQAIINPAFEHFFFWDARALSLELQAFDPVRHPDEMGNSWPVVIERLEQHPDYPHLFAKAFGSPGIDSSRVVYALAQFERTFISFNSRFDRWYYGGQIGLLTEAEQRGFDLFTGEAHCADCHMLPFFHDFSVRNVGLRGEFSDLGLEEVSGIADHRWRFKTPSLRNIEVTAPYMHDGRFATLEEVMDFYAEDVEITMPNLDPHMFPWLWGEVELDAQERADLVAFMRTLTDEGFLTAPHLADPH